MRVLKSVARFAFRKGGGAALMRRLNRRSLRILVYHRFPEETGPSLEAHCAHLRRYYNPVSLLNVQESVRTGVPLPPNSIAVTVDDGYKDFYSVAFPHFFAYGIPVTVFLVTSFVDGKIWLWVDRIRHSFLNARVRVAKIDLDLGKPFLLPLETIDHRIRAFFLVKEVAKHLPNEQRLELVNRLPALLEAELPDAPPPDSAPLSWNEIRFMAGCGIRFGAHTRTHPILSRISGEVELCDEIAGSKQRIEQELSVPVHEFCYPNGMVEDIQSAAVKVVRDSGYKTAVTMQPGIIPAGSDPFLLRRIAVDADQPVEYFAQLASGFGQKDPPPRRISGLHVSSI